MLSVFRVSLFQSRFASLLYLDNHGAELGCHAEIWPNPRWYTSRRPSAHLFEAAQDTLSALQYVTSITFHFYVHGHTNTYLNKCTVAWYHLQQFFVANTLQYLWGTFYLTLVLGFETSLSSSSNSVHHHAGEHRHQQDQESSGKPVRDCLSSKKKLGQFEMGWWKIMAYLKRHGERPFINPLSSSFINTPLITKFFLHSWGLKQIRTHWM